MSLLGSPPFPLFLRVLFSLNCDDFRSPLVPSLLRFSWLILALLLSSRLTTLEAVRPVLLVARRFDAFGLPLLTLKSEVAGLLVAYLDGCFLGDIRGPLFWPAATATSVSMDLSMAPFLLVPPDLQPLWRLTTLCCSCCFAFLAAWFAFSSVQNSFSFSWSLLPLM